MSDPISAISTTATVASTASDVVGAFSSSDQYSAQASADQYNAETARENALLARRQGEVEALQIRRRGQDILGEQVANYAASGVTQDGSSADVRADTMAKIETDMLTAKYNAELKAIGYDRTAELDAMQADSASAAGDTALASGLLGAVPKVVDAGKSVYNLFK